MDSTSSFQFHATLSTEEESGLTASQDIQQQQLPMDQDMGYMFSDEEDETPTRDRAGPPDDNPGQVIEDSSDEAPLLGDSDELDTMAMIMEPLDPVNLPESSSSKPNSFVQRAYKPSLLRADTSESLCIAPSAVFAPQAARPDLISGGDTTARSTAPTLIYPSTYSQLAKSSRHASSSSPKQAFKRTTGSTEVLEAKTASQIAEDEYLQAYKAAGENGTRPKPRPRSVAMADKASKESGKKAVNRDETRESDDEMQLVPTTSRTSSTSNTEGKSTSKKLSKASSSKGSMVIELYGTDDEDEYDRQTLQREIEETNAREEQDDDDYDANKKGTKGDRWNKKGTKGKKETAASKKKGKAGAADRKKEKTSTSTNPSQSTKGKAKEGLVAEEDTVILGDSDVDPDTSTSRRNSATKPFSVRKTSKTTSIASEVPDSDDPPIIVGTIRKTSRLPETLLDSTSAKDAEKSNKRRKSNKEEKQQPRSKEFLDDEDMEDDESPLPPLPPTAEDDLPNIVEGDAVTTSKPSSTTIKDKSAAPSRRISATYGTYGKKGRKDNAAKPKSEETVPSTSDEEAGEKGVDDDDDFEAAVANVSSGNAQFVIDSMEVDTTNEQIADPPKTETAKPTSTASTSKAKTTASRSVSATASIRGNGRTRSSSQLVEVVVHEKPRSGRNGSSTAPRRGRSVSNASRRNEMQRGKEKEDNEDAEAQEEEEDLPLNKPKATTAKGKKGNVVKNAVVDSEDEEEPIKGIASETPVTKTVEVVVSPPKSKAATTSSTRAAKAADKKQNKAKSKAVIESGEDEDEEDDMDASEAEESDDAESVQPDKKTEKAKKGTKEKTDLKAAAETEEKPDAAKKVAPALVEKDVNQPSNSKVEEEPSASSSKAVAGIIAKPKSAAPDVKPFLGIVSKFGGGLGVRPSGLSKKSRIPALLNIRNAPPAKKPPLPPPPKKKPKKGEEIYSSDDETEKKDQPEEWWDGEDYQAWEIRKRKRAKARGEVESDSEDEKKGGKKKQKKVIESQQIVADGQGETVVAGDADQVHFSD